MPPSVHAVIRPKAMLREVSWSPTKPDLSGFLDEKAIKAAKRLLRAESVSLRTFETGSAKNRRGHGGTVISEESDGEDEWDPSDPLRTGSLPAVPGLQQGSGSLENQLMIERLLSTRVQLQSQGSTRLGLTAAPRPIPTTGGAAAGGWL